MGDEVPALFSRITSQKIAQLLVERYQYETHENIEDKDKRENDSSTHERSIQKRYKFGIKMLDKGQKIGSKTFKQQAEEASNAQGPKGKRKSASEILQSNLKKK